MVILVFVTGWTLLCSSGGCFVEKMDLMYYAAFKYRSVQVYEYVQMKSLAQICRLHKDDSVEDAHIVGIRS